MYGNKNVGMRYVCTVYRIVFYERMDNVMWSASIRVLNPYEALRIESANEQVVCERVSTRHRIAIFLRKLANIIDK